MHAFVPRNCCTRETVYTTYIAGITALTKVFIGQFIASEVATASIAIYKLVSYNVNMHG